jgi:6-pyruvoyltetrahydropterin/6-carboxytetrahydropterin synthase
LYFVTKTLDPDKGFSCAFRQHTAQSHCRFIHGYDLRFSITFGCDKLDSRGWVIDFGALKPLKERIEQTFDHKLVVAEDDPHLDGFKSMHAGGVADVVVMQKVGCEAFALWLAAEAFDLLHALGETDRVRILHTKVHEHGANMAGYSPHVLGPMQRLPVTP